MTMFLFETAEHNVCLHYAGLVHGNLGIIARYIRNKIMITIIIIIIIIITKIKIIIRRRTTTTTEPKQIDREARKIVVGNGGKHPCGSTSL